MRLKLLHSPYLFAILTLFLCQVAFAQNKTVTGRVTDSSDGSAMVGVSVSSSDGRLGTITDIDGKYSLVAPQAMNSLVFSYTGYVEQVVDISNQSSVNISLKQGNAYLDEVVVIGYGTVKKSDLTGAVTAVSEKDFNKGTLVSPQQMIAGKVAGVQIISSGGQPGGGGRIRIRQGSSLNASNDPLIVIDGVPVDNGKISGAGNPLSLINPNDIESFNILKDASAAAIYGSRASNGVILITTKRGSNGGKLQVDLNTTQSIAQPGSKVDVLSADEFRTVVNREGTATQIALLGNSNTDWQDEIYQAARTSDINLSLTGGIKGLPYRLSLATMDQDGILRTDNLQRNSIGLNLSPKFLNKSLSVDVNFKGSQSNSHFAPQGAIGNAVFFDPTQPKLSGSDTLGGYFEYLDPATGTPNTLAPKNPLSQLAQYNDESEVIRSIGNVQLDYKLPWVSGLRANLNLGYDYVHGSGKKILPRTLAEQFYNKGTTTEYDQKKNNKLLEFYLRYDFNLGSRSDLNVTAGYSYQDWIREEPSFATFRGIDTIAKGNDFKTQNTLVSFFGRLNYTFDSKYLLTATVRRDGSSRFSPDNRWGTFPSVALAWRIGQENFLRNSNVISDLKLRVGYGITGQQDIGTDYPYLARFTPGDSSSTYLFGSDYYTTLRPEGYDLNIKWEETATANAGLDFGFFKNRVYGSIDIYQKKTKDLLAVIPVPIGSNLTNRLLTNVGNIENNGLEISLGSQIVRSKDFSWNANFNITFNNSEITNLTKVVDKNAIGVEVGEIAGGVGNLIQIHTVGYNPFAFFVFQQVYDTNGKPIEGVYVDRNKDGVVNDQDRYRYKTPDAQVYLGFNSQFDYKNWTLGFSTRANFGNYLYNNFNGANAAYASFGFNNYLGNMPSNVLETQFEQYQLKSDYYIENASFFRMDYISLGYNFGRVFNDKIGVRLSFTVQNVFVLTKYTGIDPEIAGGIDRSFYPNPRVFSLGANLSF
ncbi:MAG: TonB-dependent receptor [Saprospiraceae bacterium]